LLAITYCRRAGPGACAIAAGSPAAQALLARSDQHAFRNEPEQLLPVLTPEGWRVLVGLGAPSGLSASVLRHIGGMLFARLAGGGITHLQVDPALSSAQLAQLAYGMCLRAWRPAASYRQKADPEKIWYLSRVTLVCRAPNAVEACMVPLLQLANAVHLARDLAVAPANYLTPPAFVAALRDIEGVELELVDPALAGLALLQAVGQGSRYKPTLALLHWRGGARRDAPVALVGKGITFDTGGIDIKPRLHMQAMKGDMSGAAAVAGALQALAARRAPINAVGVLAIAENMPSGRALRPGDVIEGHAGLTVEVIDTDAEGRLVLADALSYAAKRFHPSLMIDLATLTGAVEVTLGRHRAGLFTADDSLAASLFAAGEAEEENLWRLPLTDCYDRAIASDVADLRNCSWERGPDALHAARFLERFVPDCVAWAHLDIAGMSETAEDAPLAAAGPTGFGVRLLDRLLRDLFETAP
jgi:leucyl aminopeptidase